MKAEIRYYEKGLPYVPVPEIRELPEGAHAVKNYYDEPMIELANGCTCPDLVTTHRKGEPIPCVVDTVDHRGKLVALKVIE